MTFQRLQVVSSSCWFDCTLYCELHEASLFALVSLSDQLIEAEGSKVMKLNLGNLLEQMINEDMLTGVHQCPFLHARAFSTISKFYSLISRQVSKQLLYAAIQAIASDVPAPVKVGVCRALTQLLPLYINNVQPYIMGLMSSLTTLLRQASEETLHLVLETLQGAIKAGHEQSTTIEPAISPIILDVWLQHVSDPFISIDAVEVLEMMLLTIKLCKKKKNVVIPTCSMMTLVLFAVFVE